MKKIYIPEFGLIDIDELSVQLSTKPLWQIQREERAAKRLEEHRIECQREMIRWAKIKQEEKKKARSVKVRENVNTFPRRYFLGMIPRKTPHGYVFPDGRHLYGGDVGFGVLDGISKSRFAS